jgi:hypothetical protein
MAVTATAKPGGVGVLEVRARSIAGASCELRVRAARHVLAFRSAILGRSGSASWRWLSAGIPSDVVWRFTVTCHHQGFWSQRWMGAEPGFPSRAALAVPGSGAPGSRCDLQGVCLAEDPSPLGQCTWYAIGWRRDLQSIVSGNAGDWLEEARGRVPVGSRPAVGALAVWAPNREGMSADGHVAYVARVSGRRILLYDSNWTPTATSPETQVHEHWMSAASPSGYIYGGPAGAGPQP